MKADTFSRKKILVSSLVLFILFIFYTFLVKKGIFNTLDFNLTVKLQDRIARSWEPLFTFLSFLGLVEVTGVVWLILVIYSIVKKYWLVAVSLLLFVLNSFLEILGKTFIYHPGPPHLFFRGLELFDFPRHYISTSYSYPSGHIIRTTFLCIVLASLVYFSKNRFKKYLIIFLLFLLFLMIVSRIYLGEHWTSDVFGGLLLGSASGLLATFFLLKYYQK